MTDSWVCDELVVDLGVVHLSVRKVGLISVHFSGHIRPETLLLMIGATVQPKKGGTVDKGELHAVSMPWPSTSGTAPVALVPETAVREFAATLLFKAIDMDDEVCVPTEEAVDGTPLVLKIYSYLHSVKVVFCIRQGADDVTKGQIEIWARPDHGVKFGVKRVHFESADLRI